MRGNVRSSSALAARVGLAVTALAFGIVGALVSPGGANAEPGTVAATSGAAATARPFWLDPGGSRATSGLARPFAAAAQPPVTPDQAFTRTMTWLTANGGGPVPYSKGQCFPSFSAAPCAPPKYRTDCSGYVSMILGLSGSLVTGDMVKPSFATPISKDQLQPGDILVNPTPNDGHVVLFEKWNNAAHTQYTLYEQSGDGGTHHRSAPYPYFGTYPMSPYHYIGMTNGGTATPQAPDLNGDGVADLVSLTSGGDLYAYPGSGVISDGTVPHRPSGRRAASATTATSPTSHWAT
jgi:hypothetical protein